MCAAEVRKDLNGIGCYDERLLELEPLGPGRSHLGFQFCVLGVQPCHFALVRSFELLHLVVQCGELGVVGEEGRGVEKVACSRAHHIPAADGLVFGCWKMLSAGGRSMETTSA